LSFADTLTHTLIAADHFSVALMRTQRYNSHGDPLGLGGERFRILDPFAEVALV
jgi:hypothetical protein